MDIANWQEWMVGLIVGICLGITLYKIYQFFFKRKQTNNPCEHCTWQCEAKKQKKVGKIVGDSRKSTTFASANLDKG